MKPVEFAQANTKYAPPLGMSHNEFPIRSVLKAIDTKGRMIFIEKWQPSQADIDAIVAGRGIFVKVTDNALPPVTVFTLDRSGEVNVE